MSEEIVPQEEQEVKYRRAKHVRIACGVDSVGSHCETGTRQPSGIGPGWNLGKSRFAPNIGDLGGSIMNSVSYSCNCVLPEQSCPDCEAAARAIYDNDDGELPF
jgi:hypothetical protein